MAVLLLKPHLTIKEIELNMRHQKDLRIFSYWQILWSVGNNPKKTAKEYGSFLGVSEYKVYRIVQLYNKLGKDFDKGMNWGGRRDTNAFLSFEEEENLIESIRQRAKEGKVLVAKDIKKVVEEKVGEEVSDDYLWDLLKRHKWKKKSPRPYHPKKNQESQDEFKKNSQKFWHPTN
jgi:transposase